ncbi:MAG: hypothetical protein KAS97_08920, partial [Candidatus Aminicenantes bacterium]|nr:hypothetical protein [Candidatus Aminicenantes bacterium]
MRYSSYLRVIQDKNGLLWMRFVIQCILLIILVSLPIYSLPKDNTLIYLSPVDVITFDPGMVNDIYSSQMIGNMFEGLTRYKNGTIK